jgi:hypothetical protein
MKSHALHLTIFQQPSEESFISALCFKRQLFEVQRLRRMVSCAGGVAAFWRQVVCRGAHQRVRVHGFPHRLSETVP